MKKKFLFVFFLCISREFCAVISLKQKASPTLPDRNTESTTSSHGVSRSKWKGDIAGPFAILDVLFLVIIGFIIYSTFSGSRSVKYYNRKLQSSSPKTQKLITSFMKNNIAKGHEITRKLIVNERGKFFKFLRDSDRSIKKNMSEKQIFELTRDYLHKTHKFDKDEISDLRIVLKRAMKVKDFLLQART